ncbi:MAG: hypothetical protein IH947_01045 [Bacteroidetes bacterium]|nr:hypothetical protein [Bacteroidota bacterium]MCH8231774.1 hypothetical protein [Bacteroidota bacterium]
MKILLKTGAWIGFGLTLIPALLVWSGVINLDMNKTLMLLGTVIWFVCAPFAFKRKV